MKYTILGFSQQHLLNLGLGMDEAMILRWFVDFQGTGKMRPVIHEGKTWLWVNYSGVLEDLPIVGGSAKTISRRFERLVDSGVLEHVTIKEGGVFSCFRLCESVYTRLVDSDDQKEEIEGLDRSVQPETEVSNPWTDLSEQKTLLLDTNTPLENINILFPPTGEPRVSNQEKFERFWEAYPRKKAKGDAEKAWKKLKPDDELFFKILSAIAAQKNGLDWTKDSGKFIPYPATWIRAKGWCDEVRPPDRDSDKFRSGRVNELWAGKKSGKVTL